MTVEGSGRWLAGCQPSFSFIGIVSILSIYGGVGLGECQNGMMRNKHNRVGRATGGRALSFSLFQVPVRQKRPPLVSGGVSVSRGATKSQTCPRGGQPGRECLPVGIWRSSVRQLWVTYHRPLLAGQKGPECMSRRKRYLGGNYIKNLTLFHPPVPGRRKLDVEECKKATCRFPGGKQWVVACEEDAGTGGMGPKPGRRKGCTPSPFCRAGEGEGGMPSTSLNMSPLVSGQREFGARRDWSWGYCQHQTTADRTRPSNMQSSRDLVPR
ncbi:hypothetical protein LZ30DRAFT_741780 [Colletotrichum cereale]|nr:hypothetical protein LZ30DRAFT_741780 [Colletotrichum cereale]